MFSNPLKRVAEEYLRTNDSSVRRRTRQQLIRAGAKAVAPLIKALITTIRKYNSASVDRNQVQMIYDAIADAANLPAQYREILRKDAEQMSDEGGGISLVQAMQSREACIAAWQVISQIGEPGVRALFTLINGRDERVRLAAILALSTEKYPDRFILNSLVIANTNIVKTTPNKFNVAANLLMSLILAMNGDQREKESLEKYWQEMGVSVSESTLDRLVDESISLLAK